MKYFFDWYLWYYLLLIVFGWIYKRQKIGYLASDSGSGLKSEDDYRAGILFSIMVFLPLILISGFRNTWIGDTSTYIEIYKKLPSSISEYLGQVDWNSKNPGFYVFSVFIKSIFGSDYRTWLVLIAAISGICLAIGYRRYSINIVISTFLFFASTEYYGWMMNGMRQFLVAALIFAFFPLLQKRKYIWFILIILLLFTVHQTCIIVIPLFLCALGKPFNKRTIIFLVLCLLAVVFVGDFLNLLNDSLQGTAYSNSVSSFKGDNGTNFFRVIVYAIPSIIAIIKRREITDETPEIIKISINMSLITAGLYFISMFTSGIHIGRLPIYFSLFNYILLPWELKRLFDENSGRILTGLMFVFYFIYYCVAMGW